MQSVLSTWLLLCLIDCSLQASQILQLSSQLVVEHLGMLSELLHFSV